MAKANGTRSAAPEPNARKHAGTAAERAAQRVEIDARRRQVAALLVSRVQQQDIARQLQVGEATISRDIAALRARWRDAADIDIADKMLQDVAALDADERQWRARMSDPQNPPSLPLRLGIYDRILRIMERRADLLGLNAPTKTEVGGLNGGPLVVEYVHDWRGPADYPAVPPSGAAASPA